jgi:putative ABC transport system permease protein
MDILENMKEGLRSVQANLLRSILTALIVAIGIMALVGILTAIDGIERSVNESLSSLGVNTFDITSKMNRNQSAQGVSQKLYPPLKLSEMNKFIDRYSVPSTVSLSAYLTGIAEVKHASEKTNPNVQVLGANEEYMAIKGLELQKGRGLSALEVEYGTNAAVIGHKIYTTLYKKENEDPINSKITFLGTQFKVIGVIEEKGQLAEDNYDNMIIIPIRLANQMAKGRGLSYELTVGVNDAANMDHAMGEATGLMRAIRMDPVGKENSFDLERSETLAQEMESITSALRLGGFGVGFITLLGASIALMNIMLVSVTERTREVGVRKALGATPLRIRQQFVIEAIVVCLLGGVVGVILGILIGNGISRLMDIDIFVIPWGWMTLGMVVCVGVGLISGYYPAYKASKLDPIESLRFE